MARARTNRRRHPPEEVDPEARTLSVRPQSAQGGATPNRLHKLRLERERLLRDISKKKNAFEATLSAARDAEVAFEARMAPLRLAISETNRQIRAIFEFYCGPKSPLTAKQAAKVRQLYQQVMPSRVDDDLDDDGSDEDDDLNDATQESTRHNAQGQRSGKRNQDHADYARGSGERDVASAAKPQAASDGLLRTIFRRLAVALHPDKVQKASDKEERTRIMKDVTRAYETSDIARLLELEQKWLADAPSSVGAEVAAELEASLAASNRELRRQMRFLTEELKALKRSVPGMAKARNMRGTAAHLTEGDVLIDEMTRAATVLTQIRDFAVNFQQGRIPLAAFLRGPAIDPDLLPDPNDTLDDMLEVMISDMFEDQRPRGSKRRHR